MGVLGVFADKQSARNETCARQRAWQAGRGVLSRQGAWRALTTTWCSVPVFFRRWTAPHLKADARRTKNSSLFGEQYMKL